MDGDDDDGSSKTDNEVRRTALTSTVVIGSLRGDHGNVEHRPSLDSGGDAGFRLGTAPQNKFCLQNSRPCDTQLIEEDDSGDDGDGGDQVQCPLCSGLFAPSVIESHAASCTSSPDLTSAAADHTEGAAPVGDEPEQRCPVCHELLQVTSFEGHVQYCAERNFS